MWKNWFHSSEQLFVVFVKTRVTLEYVTRKKYLSSYDIWRDQRKGVASTLNASIKLFHHFFQLDMWHMTYASLLDIISVLWLVFVSLWCSQWSEAVKSLWDLASDPRYNIKYYTGASTLLSHLLLAAMHSISWICLQILNNKENPPSFSDEA